MFETERAQLDEEWRKLAEERKTFEAEKSAFEEERGKSDIEVKLFVGNLGSTTDEDAVKKMFGEYGSVKEVVILKDREGNSKRSCFVKYFTAKDANKAIAGLDGKKKDADSRDCLAVRYANPKGTQKADPAMMGMMGMGMSNYGMGGYGMGQMAQMGQMGQANASGYDPYGGVTAMPSQNPYQTSQFGAYGGYTAAPTATQPSVVTSSGSGRGPPGGNLYVNNLQAGTTQEDLQSMFGDFGKVVSIKLFSTPNGPLMYGFVSYEDPASAQAAISALDGMDIGNSRRALEVRLKKEGSSKNNRFTPY